MTDHPTTRLPDEAARLADHVADAALGVPGVAGLHGGEFGEIATYLPGRKVVGVVVGHETCAVHIAASYPGDPRAVAAAVNSAVSALVTVPVIVTVEDLVL